MLSSPTISLVLFLASGAISDDCPPISNNPDNVEITEPYNFPVDQVQSDDLRCKSKVQTPVIEDQIAEDSSPDQTVTATEPDTIIVDLADTETEANCISDRSRDNQTSDPDSKPTAPDINSPVVVSPQVTCPTAADLASQADENGETFSDEDIILVTARPGIEADPLEQLNVDSYLIVQDVDEALVAPAAKTYERTVPSPIRSGIRNFLANLSEPIVALNYLLQFKPGKVAETLARFTVNTTVGVAGLIDVAKSDPINLPRRRNGFANTLGYYGVEAGAYLFLPLVGSTTVRDLFGGTVDLLIYPTVIGSPFNDRLVTVPIGIVTGLDSRAQADEELTRIRDESADGYGAIRDNYLNRRQAEIDALHGRAATPSEPESEIDGSDQVDSPAVVTDEPLASSDDEGQLNYVLEFDN